MSSYIYKEVQFKADKDAAVVMKMKPEAWGPTFCCHCESTYISKLLDYVFGCRHSSDPLQPGGTSRTVHHRPGWPQHGQWAAALSQHQQEPQEDSAAGWWRSLNQNTLGSSWFCGPIAQLVSAGLSLYVFLSVFQLDHYPVSTYMLPEACDGNFRMVKSIFLGKVFGECLKKWRWPGWTEEEEHSVFQKDPVSVSARAS